MSLCVSVCANVPVDQQCYEQTLCPRRFQPLSGEYNLLHWVGQLFDVVGVLSYFAVWASRAGRGVTSFRDLAIKINCKQHSKEHMM